MKAPVSFSASQIVASVLGAGVLLGGAYAVGRAQSPAAPATVAQTAAAEPAPLKAQLASEKPTSSRAESKAVDEAKPAKPEAVALCADCARVLAVQEETREGKASGLGAVGGAVIGGLLGNQIGGGTGKKIATVGGAVAGGMAGNEIEKRQKSHRVWVVRVKLDDGRVQSFVREHDPQFQVGDVLRVRNGQWQRQS